MNWQLSILHMGMRLIYSDFVPTVEKRLDLALVGCPYVAESSPYKRSRAAKHESVA